jgi:hypothetical protein
MLRRNRARRAVLVALVGLGGFIALPDQSAACSCDPVSSPRERFAVLALVDVVFRGRVVEVEEVEERRQFHAYSTRARLRADGVWQGPVRDEYFVLGGHSDVDCSVVWREGRDYLVLAWGRPGEALETNICARVHGGYLAPGPGTTIDFGRAEVALKWVVAAGYLLLYVRQEVRCRLEDLAL